MSDFPEHRLSCATGARRDGFAELMAELSTVVAHNLPFKIIVLKNNSLAEVKFEQREIGNPNMAVIFGQFDSVACTRLRGRWLSLHPTGRTAIYHRRTLRSRSRFWSKRWSMPTRKLPSQTI